MYNHLFYLAFVVSIISYCNTKMLCIVLSTIITFNIKAVLIAIYHKIT